MQVSSNNTLRLLSDIDLKKVEAQKEINQCNASLAKIDKQLKNSHLSRTTKGRLLENQVQLIERIDQLQFTLIKLNTLAQKVIARQNAPQVAQVPALQNRLTVALPVPTPIQEIEEEPAEKEEMEESKSEIIEEKETVIPNQETRESTLAKPLNEVKPLTPNSSCSRSSISNLFSMIEGTFFFMTGINPRRLFERQISPFNQVVIRRVGLSLGLFAVSTAVSCLFLRGQAAAGSLAVATSSSAGSINLREQYDALHQLIRYYIKDRGHSLEWCLRHGKITLELFNYIIQEGLMKKHW